MRTGYFTIFKKLELALLKYMNKKLVPTSTKIFFVPSYIGSLKYYERIAERMKNKYDVAYVLVQPYKKKREGMIKYCRDKDLKFYDLTESLDRALKIRFPFFSPLRKRYLHSKECRTFLEKEHPYKIIATKAQYPNDTILKEANRLGIETLVLSWAFYGVQINANDWLKNIPKGKNTPVFFSATRLYYNLLKALSFFLDIFYEEPRYGLAPAKPKKVSAMTEKEVKLLLRYFDRKTMHVIPSIDIQLAYELKQKIETDHAYKTKLLKKYNLSSQKIKIFLVLYRFYSRRGQSFDGLNTEEHLAYYNDIFRILRGVFSAKEADLFMKLHPAEENIYDSYKKFGVQIFGDEASIEELVCMSDLYIASPMTNVNYLVLGSGVPALFINLMQTSGLDPYVENFHIKHVVTRKKEFADLAQLFRDGKLPKQYNSSGVNFKSLDAAIKFIDEHHRGSSHF
jgi:hypothetical protein